jgi:hypothetical protein
MKKDIKTIEKRMTDDRGKGEMMEMKRNGDIFNESHVERLEEGFAKDTIGFSISLNGGCEVLKST